VYEFSVVLEGKCFARLLQLGLLHVFVLDLSSLLDLIIDLLLGGIQSALEINLSFNLLLLLGKSL
jgi:hypothetical protein